MLFLNILSAALAGIRSSLTNDIRTSSPRVFQNTTNKFPALSPAKSTYAMSMTCCFTLLDVVHVQGSSTCLDLCSILRCLFPTPVTVSTSPLLLDGSIPYCLFRDCDPCNYNKYIATTSFLSVSSAALHYAPQRCSVFSISRLPCLCFNPLSKSFRQRMLLQAANPRSPV